MQFQCFQVDYIGALSYVVIIALSPNLTTNHIQLIIHERGSVFFQQSAIAQTDNIVIWV